MPGVTKEGESVGRTPTKNSLIYVRNLYTVRRTGRDLRLIGKRNPSRRPMSMDVFTNHAAMGAIDAA